MSRYLYCPYLIISTCCDAGVQQGLRVEADAELRPLRLPLRGVEDCGPWGSRERHLTIVIRFTIDTMMQNISRVIIDII